MSSFVIPKLALGKVASGGGWGLGDHYTVLDPVAGAIPSSVVDAGLAQDTPPEAALNDFTTVLADDIFTGIVDVPVAPVVTPSLVAPSVVNDPPLEAFTKKRPSVPLLDIAASAYQWRQPVPAGVNDSGVPAPGIAVTPVIDFGASPPCPEDEDEPSSPARTCDFGSEVSSMTVPVPTGVKCVLARSSTEVWFGGKDGTVQTYDLQTRSGELVPGAQIKIKSAQRAGGEDIMRCMAVVSVAVGRKPNIVEEQQLWCGFNNGKLVVWSIETKKIVELVVGHSAAVTALVFVKISGRVWSSSLDGSIRVWDTATRKLVTRCVHKKGVRGLVFIPTTNNVWSCSNDGTISSWTLEGLLCKTVASKLGQVVCIRFDPKERCVWSGADNCVHVWDATSGHLVWKCDQINAHAIDITERHVVLAMRQAQGGQMETIDTILFLTRNVQRHVAKRIPNQLPIWHMQQVTRDFLVVCYGGAAGSKVSVFTLNDMTLQRPFPTFDADPSRQHHPALDHVVSTSAYDPHGETNDFGPGTAKSEDTIVRHGSGHNASGSHHQDPVPRYPTAVPVVVPLLEGRGLPPLIPSSQPSSAHASGGLAAPHSGQQRHITSARDTPPSGGGGHSSEDTSKRLRRIERKLDVVVTSLPERTRVTEYVNDVVHLYGFAQSVKVDVLPNATLKVLDEHETEDPALQELSTNEARTVGAVMHLLALRVVELQNELMHRSQGSPEERSPRPDLGIVKPPSPGTSAPATLPAVADPTPLLLRILAEVTSRRHGQAQEIAAPAAVRTPAAAATPSLETKIDEILQHIRQSRRQDEDRIKPVVEVPLPPSDPVGREDQKKVTSDASFLSGLRARAQGHAKWAAERRAVAEKKDRVSLDAARSTRRISMSAIPVVRPTVMCREHPLVDVLARVWGLAEVRGVEAKLQQSRTEITNKVGLSRGAAPLPIVSEIQASQKIAAIDLEATGRVYLALLAQSPEGQALVGNIVAAEGKGSSVRPLAAYHAWCRAVLDALETVENNVREGLDHADHAGLRREWASKVRDLEAVCQSLREEDRLSHDRQSDLAWEDSIGFLQTKANAIARYLSHDVNDALRDLAASLHGRPLSSDMSARLSDAVHGTTPRGAENVLALSVDADGNVDSAALIDHIRKSSGVTIAMVRGFQQEGTNGH